MSSKFTIALAILATSYLYEQYGDRDVRSPPRWWANRRRNRLPKKEKVNDEWNKCVPCELCPRIPENLLLNGNFEDNDPTQHNPTPGHNQNFAMFVDTSAIAPWSASSQWVDGQASHELSGPFTPVQKVEINKRQQGNEAKDWDVRGTWGLDLNRDKPIKISQTVSGIEANQRYRLSFLVSANRCRDFQTDIAASRYNPRVKSGFFEVQGQQFAFAYDTQLRPGNIATRIVHTFTDLVPGDAEVSIASTTRGVGPTACGPVIDNVKFVKICPFKNRVKKYGGKKSKSSSKSGSKKPGYNRKNKPNKKIKPYNKSKSSSKSGSKKGYNKKSKSSSKSGSKKGGRRY